MNEFHRTEVATRIGSLIVQESGTGQPLILLPANGHCADDFEEVAKRWVASYRVIAVDWPAMGFSLPPQNPASITAPSLADAVEDIVKALKLKRVSLLGHSVGGFCATRFAIRHPHLIHKLVLVDSGGFNHGGLLERWFCSAKGRVIVTRLIEGWFARYHTGTRTPSARELVERVNASRTKPGYSETVASIWRSFNLPESTLRAGAKQISCPTLILWGENDPVIPLSIAREMASLIPSASLVTFAARHSPFLDVPEEFATAVASFLG